MRYVICTLGIRDGTYKVPKNVPLFVFMFAKGVNEEVNEMSEGKKTETITEKVVSKG